MPSRRLLLVGLLLGVSAAAQAQAPAADEGGAAAEAAATDTAVVQEEEEAPHFEGEAQIAVANAYYFRGTDLFERNTPTLFPSLTFGYSDPGISLNVWAAVPLAKRSLPKNQEGHDEIDLTLDYSYDAAEWLGISIGFVAYLLPFVEELWHTEELYFLACGHVAGLEIGLEFFGDLDTLRGLYSALRLKYPWEIVEGLTLTPELFVGHGVYQEADSGLFESGGQLSVEYGITDWLTLAAGALYNYNVAAAEGQFAGRGAVSFGF